MSKKSLPQNAEQIRQIFLKRDFPSGNIAIAEVHLEKGIRFGMGATSRASSPCQLSIPIPRSQGGQFEPSIDPYSGRVMDTDAEYKVLSAIAQVLETHYNWDIQGQLYLYTERQPCQSCRDIIRQFREKFPNIEVDVDWSYPYPP